MITLTRSVAALPLLGSWLCLLGAGIGASLVAGVNQAEAQPRARLLVLIAANGEWGPTKDLLKPANVERTPYGESFTLAIAGEPVRFLHAGWGKIAAAAATEYAIGRWNPELLIVLGTSGGVEGRVQRLDRLLVTRTVVYDIQEAMGDSAEAIASYSTTLDLDWLDAAFPLKLRRATMFSADRDLVAAGIAELTKRYGEEAVAADWESGAIAHVARLRGTRLLILRAISDLVGPTRGEAENNEALFRERAVASMRLLLDDLRALVPYALSRLSATRVTR